MKPFNFTGDSKLPPHIAQIMQSVADSRADRGLISGCGKTHTTESARDIYNMGVPTHSSEYRKASIK